MRKIYGKSVPDNWKTMSMTERLEWVNVAWREMTGLTSEQQDDHRAWAKNQTENE